MPVEPALSTLVAELGARLRERLVSVVLYGAHARGAARAHDEVRVLIELEPVDPPTLERAGPALQVAWRTGRIRPLLVGRGELARMVDSLPLEVHRLLAHHRVVHGTSPLDGLRVDPEHLRLRLEQALRDHQLLLRTTVTLRHDDPAARRRALRGIAEAIADQAEVLDDVCGIEGLHVDVLSRLAAVRDGRDDPELAAATLRWLDAAVARLDRWAP